MNLTLHNFFRSSTSTRLRVGLNLKGLDYNYVSYKLKAKENEKPDFLDKNPQGLVPVLELADQVCLNQSMSIMEWLEESYPEPPLLPKDVLGRARVRSLSYMIACDIHPLNNLRVLDRITEQFGADEADIEVWFKHWVEVTFSPLEAILDTSSETGAFCHGDQPTMADACLYAQVWNNQRFNIDHTSYPCIERIFKHCDQIEAFSKAAPKNQPDAV